MLLIPISMIALGAQLVVRVADTVPEFDLARGCRLDSAQAFDLSAGMKAPENERSLSDPVPRHGIN